MFKKAILVTLLMLVGLGAAATLTLLHYSKAEQVSFQEFVEEEAASPKNMQQERVRVRRDIVHGSDEFRRTVVFADAAHLTLDYREKDASEQLVHPVCYHQEKLLRDPLTGQPVQILRYFQAERGAYNHQEHLLNLESVSVAQYQAAGHELLTDVSGLTPLMQGTACAATVVLTPQLAVEADDLKAAFGDTHVELSSGKASYDGQQVILADGVLIRSPDGSIQTQKISLTGRYAVEGGAFDRANLETDTLVTLGNGAQLRSDAMDVDWLGGLATFHAAPGDTVEWIQPPDAHGWATKLLCRHLTIYFMPCGQPQKGLPLQIREVIAEQDVCISQDGVWQARGDVATFKADPVHGDVLSGVVTLMALRKDFPCSIETASGAQLKAVRMSYDLAKHLVTLACARAEYNENTQFENQGEVTLQLCHDNAHGIKSFSADGDTFVTLIAPEAGQRQTLISHGPVYCDCVAGRVVLSSPCSPSGVVARADQIVFIDGTAEMHADAVVIDYALATPQVSPTYLEAEGNVCLRGNLGEQAEGPGVQYALCDTLQYWPKQQRLLLSAKKGRVAILDKTNGLAVSAPAVEVRRDDATHKECIKGIGDVRFSLLERDYQRFRERFNLDNMELP